MSSIPTDPKCSNKCGSCRKPQSEVPLKHCAKCKSQLYCSRECQKSDWKNHKKLCGNTRYDPTMPKTANATGHGNVLPGAICRIANPFTALHNGTWLHNRPKKDVFKLLVDTYRMRMEDEYVFEGDVDEGSHFKRFLVNTIKLDAKREKKLLPGWWSKDSLKECLEFASSDDFSNVGFAAEKHDIQEHYSQMDMPMQLRMFSEKIDGTLAAGTSGESMLQMQMAVEANNLHATHISLNY